MSHNKNKKWFGIAFAIMTLFSVTGNTFAAPLTGDSTSTFVGVYSGVNTLMGFSDFVFVNSTRRLGILTSSPLSTVSIAGDPPQSSTSTLILLGANFIVGGSASGTYLGVNPLVFNGDFINFQVASSSKFKVSNSGSLTATNLTVTGLSYGVMIASGTTQVTTISPGASGNVLTSNGSAWISSAAPSVSSLVTPFIFGETIGAGQAVYVSDGSQATNSKMFQVDTGNALTNGLLAYYQLENNGNDFWSSNNLTNNGVTFDNGQVGNGADCGTSTIEYLSQATNIGVDGGSISVSAWVNLNTEISSGQDWVIMEQGGPTSFVEYDILYDFTGGSRQLIFRRNKRFVANQNSTYTITLGTTNWYHIVLTYDGTNIAGWVNDIQQAPNVAASGNGTNSGTDGFSICSNLGGGAMFSGHIDEVGVWNRALGGAEIQNLYYAHSGQTMVSTSLPGNGVAGSVYRTSATNSVYSDGFIGFAATDTTSGNSGNVIMGGLANLSGLSAGKRYYLGNTSGTINVGPGTVVKRVGIAVSTGTLRIFPQ